MKPLADGIRCGDCVRTIIDAVLGIDVGTRINVDANTRHVGIAGRLSVEQARIAIEARRVRGSRSDVSRHRRDGSAGWTWWPPWISRSPRREVRARLHPPPSRQCFLTLSCSRGEWVRGES